MAEKQKPRSCGAFSIPGSGSDGGLHSLDHRVQRRLALILLGVEAFGVLGDAMLVDQGEAEAMLALGLDDAVQRGEGRREGANRLQDLRGGFHCLVFPNR